MAIEMPDKVHEGSESGTLIIVGSNGRLIHIFDATFLASDGHVSK